MEEYHPPQTESQKEISNIMSHMSLLYKALVSLGHDTEVLKIPRTSNKNDFDFVCEINFSMDQEGLEISVGFVEESLDEDQILQILERGQEFMRHELNRSLKSSSITMH